MQTQEREQKSLLQTIEDSSIFFACEQGILMNADVFDGLKQIPSESVDLIFADPPYFLSNNGVTCSSGKMVSVNKGKWDTADSLEKKHEFNRSWIAECYRVLKPAGTIFISGTLHNIFSVGMALEENNFKILNNITWQKTNPPPNLACKCFTHSTETVLWAKKNIKAAKPLFNYALMKEQNGGKQMKDVWQGSLTSRKEKKHGKHPTQKPLYLLNRIVEATTAPGFIVLDPFVGSGTTAISAATHGCYFIGIDNSLQYLELAKSRIESELKEKENAGL